MPRKVKQASEPYIAAVDAIGDAWTFLITREAFFGAKRFEDFCAGLRISRARLTERLKHLVSAGILEKRQYRDAPPRYDYALTEKGLAIYPIAITMIEWAERWRGAKRAVKLIHKPCGKPLNVRSVCRHCHGEIRRDNIQWPSAQKLSLLAPQDSNVRGWRKMAMFSDVSSRPDPAIETLKAVGDRWSMLIMYNAQQTSFGVRETQYKIGMAPNILNDRLKRLVEEGLLMRTSGAYKAPYIATESGLDLLANILTTRTWAIDWINAPKDGWADIKHVNCGRSLHADCICVNCSKPVGARDIKF